MLAAKELVRRGGLRRSELNALVSERPAPGGGTGGAGGLALRPACCPVPGLVLRLVAPPPPPGGGAGAGAGAGAGGWCGERGWSGPWRDLRVSCSYRELVANVERADRVSGDGTCESHSGK